MRKYFFIFASFILIYFKSSTYLQTRLSNLYELNSKIEETFKKDIGLIYSLLEENQYFYYEYDEKSMLIKYTLKENIYFNFIFNKTYEFSGEFYYINNSNFPLN